MSDAPCHDEPARRVLAHLSKVHNGHRHFNVSADDAAVFGIGLKDLESWMAMGLPAQKTAAGDLFDHDDLYNLSLHLRLPSLHKLAMRSWVSAMRSSEQDRRLNLSYSLIDPLEDGRPVDVLTPAGLVEVAVSGSQDFYNTTVATRGCRVDLPPAIADLIEYAMREMQFYMLHDPIRWNSPFILENRLTECGGFSKLLVELAHVRGIEARHAFGLLLSLPYPTGHYWCEFLVDGQWVAADPLMIRLLTQHARLPAAEWPEHRSPVGALLRLACVSGYDRIGAPYLDCFAIKRFRQFPVVTRGDHCYRTSYTVSLCADDVVEATSAGRAAA